MGAVEFAAELLEKAGVAVAPGVGFGAGGEGFVRFSLIEPDDRVRRAGAADREAAEVLRETAERRPADSSTFDRAPAP